MDIARLKEKLGNIPDPRRPWGNLRHKLEDILVIGPAALLCSGDEDMEAFGRLHETAKVWYTRDALLYLSHNKEERNYASYRCGYRGGVYDRYAGGRVLRI